MTSLKASDYQRVATLLGCDIAAIIAVDVVESAGSGFLPDGRLKSLFEGHHFSKYTSRRFDNSHPTLSYKTWTKIYYRNGPGEHERLTQAMSLDRRAALMSASFGRFQILGSNFKACGYLDVEQFYRALTESEANHLSAFANFVKSNKALLTAIRAHDWSTFAKVYNGPAYKANKYDTKLATAYNNALRSPLSV